MEIVAIIVVLILGFYLCPYNIKKGETGLGNLIEDIAALIRRINQKLRR